MFNIYSGEFNTLRARNEQDKIYWRIPKLDSFHTPWELRLQWIFFCLINGSYIFEWLFFHGHVGFQVCINFNLIFVSWRVC